MTDFWNDFCPCAVEWKGVSIGETEGDVRVRLSNEYFATKRTKSGNRNHNEYISGGTFEIETPVTQPTQEQIIALVIGASQTAGPASKAVEIKSMVGTSMRGLAGELILKPLVGDVATTDERLWLKAHLAAPKIDADIALGIAQSIWKINWTVYDNDTTHLMATLGLNQVTT